MKISEGERIIECKYCGTQQTLPRTTDENVQSLFNRANQLRRMNEYDKAEAVYEKILLADDHEAEAYWGIILCKFGIEYVEDPKTYARIPTCHRTSYDSIVADEHYKKALEYADPDQRAIYEKEAKQIDDIQKGILAISAQEKPYDVFVCYKETDEDGKRTQDSVIANDIYYQLTNEGFKVFYAAITLESKLGSAYEPIIFSALNSAKVMLVIGTKPEYFDAVWVRNEWSRFLKMMKKDRTKMLIPCYRDMDAYELPEEFAHLQAQDMSKIGFINDIVRGIKKVIVKETPKSTVVKESVVTPANSNSVAPLLKRAFMFLEEGDWESADKYCEKVLDIDPENARAYLGKLMLELRVRKPEDLKNCTSPFYESNHYKKAMRFGDDQLKTTLEEYSTDARILCEKKREEQIRLQAKRRKKLVRLAILISGAIAAIIAFIMIYILLLQPLSQYNQAKKLMDDGEYQEAVTILTELDDFKDSVDQKMVCYQYLGRHQEVIAYYGYTEYTVPDGVTEIGDGAFKNCKTLTKITIPDSVTRIGHNAFSGCTSLTSVTLPFVGDLKTGISRTHFGYLFGADDFTKQNKYVPTSLKTVVLTGEPIIDSNAFSGCTGLTSVTIPNSVTSIGASAFSGCTGLTSVTIPDSVTSIGSKAFSGCTGLTSITIPDSVTSIDASAFKGCTGLTSVTIPNSVTSIGSSAFEGCTGLTSITIPNSVTSIGSFAFEGCTGLTSITIPGSVTNIGVSAFSGCKKLKSVTISNGVTSIGTYAFRSCTGLTSITIPNGVKSIGDKAFFDCSSLKSVTIPQSVTFIGTDVFTACTKLETIGYEGTSQEWSKIIVDNSVGEDWSSLVEYNVSLASPDAVKRY